MPEGEIFDAIERFRRELLRNERRAASELVRVYGEAWKRIKAELERLNTEYEGVKARGEKPGPNWLYQFNRARAFRDQVERELLAFAQYAEGKMREQQLEAIAAAEQHAEQLARRALGKPSAGLVVDWNRIDRASVETLLGMTQADSPLHRLLLSISSEGAKAAEDALVQGMLFGKNPREVAREMRKVLGTQLSRALTIARTETLRAHREATRASYQANSDIVKGWVWHSALDVRTCAACWAMHGTEHRLDEILDDHPNGRCAMVPKTATWAEIGKRYGIDLADIPDTNPKIEPGITLFEKLPAQKQIAILGPAKYAAWKDGKFTLGDIVGRKRSREWGTHRYERSLHDLIGDKAKEYTRLALMGIAQRAENYTVDDLIRVAGIGLRELTSEELERVVRHVANAGFDPNGLERCGGRLAGLAWNSRTLKANDALPPGEVHYLRHVVYGNEWPDGISLPEYYQSLEDVIRNPKSRILISKIGDEWQIGFLGKNQPGMQYTHIWVDYRVSTHHWITGFMTNDFDEVLNNPRRTVKRWVR